MGRVSGTSSLISRLVGDLPRHELIGVIGVETVGVEFVDGDCCAEGSVETTLSAVCAACVAIIDVAHVSQKPCVAIVDVAHV